MTASTFDATRQVHGVSIPVAGDWQIDPGHTDLAFVGRHFMLTKVRGRFTDVRGAITIADDVSLSHVRVEIGMASVESGSDVRDTHLRSSELFDVEAYPTATFESTSVDWSGSSGTVQGDLTIHGVTKRIALHVVFEGYVRDPWGGHRAVFSAGTRVNREDFGITWNVALETGGVLVSKEISIDISLEAVLSVDA